VLNIFSLGQRKSMSAEFVNVFPADVNLRFYWKLWFCVWFCTGSTVFVLEKV